MLDLINSQTVKLLLPPCRFGWAAMDGAGNVGEVSHGADHVRIKANQIAVLDDAPDNAVLCSHGDVIPDAVNGLIRRGMDVENVPRSLKKGSVFVLHRENGLYVRAEYWEPPKV